MSNETRWELRPATWGDERMMGPTLATGEAFVLRHLGYAFHFITTEPIANAMQDRLNNLEQQLKAALEERDAIDAKIKPLSNHVGKEGSGGVPTEETDG